MIGPAALEFVAQASVEIVAIVGAAPERKAALGEKVVEEFGDGAVELAHHGAEVLADFQVAQGVIVVIEEGRHQGTNPWSWV